jgi:hypothetical protein
MFTVREIGSPAALAACGAFLVPEPFGVCVVLAAAIWWLWRRVGRPWGNPLLLFRKRMILGVLTRLRGMRSPASAHHNGNRLDERDALIRVPIGPDEQRMIADNVDAAQLNAERRP